MDTYNNTENTQVLDVAEKNELQQPKKRGRKRNSPDGEKRENKISFYLTDTVYSGLGVLASIARIPMTEYVEALINREIKKYSDVIDATQQRTNEMIEELGVKS